MLADLRLALGLLTIVPVGPSLMATPGRSAAYFPVVGLLLGALLVGASQLLGATELSGWLILALWVVMTGGLHLDGLADSCDGLLATTEPARRREIMRDPRTGTWAVVGLILVLLGKWLALAEVSPLLLLAPPVIGRWAMVVAMAVFPAATPDGMAAAFRQDLDRRAVTLATVTMLLVIGGLALATVPLALLVIPIGLIVPLALGRWAAARLGGGLTGDVYGAICELVELASLILLGSWYAGS